MERIDISRVKFKHTAIWVIFNRLKLDSKHPSNKPISHRVGLFIWRLEFLFRGMGPSNHDLIDSGTTGRSSPVEASLLVTGTKKAANHPCLIRLVWVLPSFALRISFISQFLCGGSIKWGMMAATYEGKTVNQWVMDLARVRLAEFVGDSFTATSMFPNPELFGDQLSKTLSTNNLCWEGEVQYHLAHCIKVQVDTIEYFDQATWK